MLPKLHADVDGTITTLSLVAIPSKDSFQVGNERKGLLKFTIFQLRSDQLQSLSSSHWECNENLGKKTGEGREEVLRRGSV